MKSQIATATVTASTENAPASEGTRENSVQRLTASIRRAQDTASASKAVASARRDGKDWTVLLWIRMHCNVCLTALVTEHSMLIRRLARATLGGRATTALKVCLGS